MCPGFEEANRRELNDRVCHIIICELGIRPIKLRRPSSLPKYRECKNLDKVGHHKAYDIRCTSHDVCFGGVRFFVSCEWELVSMFWVNFPSKEMEFSLD